MQPFIVVNSQILKKKHIFNFEGFYCHQVKYVIINQSIKMTQQKIERAYRQLIGGFTNLSFQNLLLFVYIIMTQAERPKRKATQLSDFQNLIEIGHGAFGKVYRAVHKMAKKAFALKRISKKEVKAQNMITQLNNQIKISRQLQHPNIIKLYDTFDDGENIYLVLQLAQNGQLFNKISRQGKLDQKTAKQMIKEVVQAVAYLHSRDPPIIHRDIKPENILLDKNNKVKLADFGWSNFLNKPRNTYCGTFDYLAPQMIDKSGHDQKLDIWCIGVLTYELLSGRTPFVVSGPKNETKKIIEQNILDVNITFPNDFPILAKSFILGMVKRKAEERMTLKQIMNHQWLTTTNNQRPLQLQAMTKKFPKDVPLIDAQQSNIIASLNKRIKELEEEVNKYRINQKAFDQNKNFSDNPQYATLMKQLRKLRGIQQRSIKLQQDNEKYWQQISKKDKEIIELTGNLKTVKENQESIEKLKQDKKALQDKVKKLEKDVENLENKNTELNAELESLNGSLGARLAKGEKIALNEAQSQQYLQFLQNKMNTVQKLFESTRKSLLKLEQKQKISKQKQEELIKMRMQKARLKQQIRAQLKQDFQQQKDQILLQARNELIEQRSKMERQKDEIRKRFQEQLNSESPTKNTIALLKQDLQLQVKTLRELTIMLESTINELKMRIRELESKK